MIVRWKTGSEHWADATEYLESTGATNEWENMELHDEIEDPSRYLISCANPYVTANHWLFRKCEKIGQRKRLEELK